MRRRFVVRIGLAAVVIAAGLAAAFHRDLFETRVRDVVPGRIARGAWQRPRPLRRLIDRKKIRTIVTLTAINRDDPKYVAQDAVVRDAGIDWVIVPMRGSTATIDQMSRAADLLADPARQPVFFHCVGGHHRTGLVHAAYRIRYQGWTADRAWRELESLPWTRPEDHRDRRDRALIEVFADSERVRRERSTRRETADDAPRTSQGGPDHRGESRRPDYPHRPGGRL